MTDQTHQHDVAEDVAVDASEDMDNDATGHTAPQVIDLRTPATSAPAPQRPLSVETSPADDASLWEQEVAEDPDAVPLPPMRQALEAVLLVVESPVAEMTLAQVLERPTEVVATELRALAAEYEEQGRGFVLRHVAGGWRLYTRPDCAPYVEKFVRDGAQTKLTNAALETLAIVAYRQPISRGKISAVRGVNVDGVMRTLTTRNLIEEDGSEPESGALLYRTTPYFLERLGLASLSELPPLAPHLGDLSGVEEQLEALDA